MSDLPEVLATAVVGPTDRLVIVLPAKTGPDVLKDCREHVANFWSEVADRILFVAGAEQLAVIKGDADE